MKKRLTAGTMLIVVLALLLSVTVQVWNLRETEMESARQSLHELLNMADAQNAITDPEKLLEMFTAAAPEKRLTIIAPDGTVILDSDSDTTENHAGREEVRQALLTGWGEAARHSETLGVPLLYVAKTFSDGTVGRAAMPVSSVNSLMMDSLVVVLVAALAAFLLAFLLAGQMARRVVEPFHLVGTSLQRVLDGDTSAGELERYEGDDELRPILRNIEQLIARLGEHIDQIEAERDKVSLILDCMDEGLILLDEEDNILAINRAGRALFGLRENQSESGIQILFHSRRVRQAMETVRRDGLPVVLDLRDETFGDRELRMFLTPVSGRRYEGERVGSSVLVTDVTELKKAENIRSEFTANVSHELKTPLTSIKGFTDMMASGMVRDEEARRRFLTMIGVEVDRLIDLINDILKISELESAAMEQSEETASPLETAREVAGLLGPRAEKEGVAISVRGDGGEARIAPGRLKELLMNLMENAVKYAPAEGGHVRVTVEDRGEEMVFAVSDNGIGIPEEAQSRVFERFYRVDKSRDRKSGGTGLGLAIVKHICQLYGGSVTLQSADGKGSTFTVTLPKA